METMITLQPFFYMFFLCSPNPSWDTLELYIQLTVLPHQLVKKWLQRRKHEDAEVREPECHRYQ